MDENLLPDKLHGTPSDEYRAAQDDLDRDVLRPCPLT